MQAEPQNEYGLKPVLKPKYRPNRITPQLGNTYVMSDAGGETITIECVAKPWNKGRSVFAFDATIAAQAADYVNMFVNNLPFFRQIEFFDKNNFNMCNITNLDVYTRIMANSDHSEEELRTKGETPLYPVGRDSVLRNVVTTDDINNGIVLVLADGDPIADNTPLTNIRVKPQYIDPCYQSRYEADASVNIPFDEQAYFTTSGGNNTPITFHFRIPMSYFKNTIVAEDKDVVYSDITYIRFTLNPKANVGFPSDNLAKQMTDVAKNGDNTAVLPLVSVTLSNVYFYQAMETNEEINKMLMESLDKGTLELNFSWVECQTINATTQSQNWYVKYGPGKGMRLQRIYWTCLPQDFGGLTPNLRYSTTNINGAKIASFTTKIDEERLQQFDVDCRDANGNQDYMLMRDLLEGGVCGNCNINQYKWFWCENFGPESRLIDHDNTKYSNSGPGKDISQRDVKYDVKCVTTNTPNTYYIYGIIQRKLRITRIGIEVI